MWYILAFIIGVLAGTIIHSFIVKYYEDKNYCNELDFEFCRETLNDQKEYKLRKAAFEQNIGKQLDINKLKNDKINNQVLQEVKRRDLMQNINKYKQILRGE